jgi:hypothetical protein
MFGCAGKADAETRGFWAAAADVVVAGFAGETARTETGSIIHATTQNSAHIIPQERDIFIWDIGTVTDIMVMMRFDVDPVLIL